MFRPARVLGAFRFRTHQPGDADTGLAVCLTGSGARSATGSTSLGSARSPDPVSLSLPPQPGLRSARPSESRCGRPVARRKAAGFGVPGFLSQPCPPPDLCARSPGILPADAQRGGRRRGGVPGSHWIIIPVQEALFYTPRLWQIITQFGEGNGEAQGITPRREPRLPKKQIRPSLAFIPGKGRLLFGSRPRGPETGSWRSPEPVHGESEAPASAPEAGQRPDPRAPQLRLR